MPQFMPRSKTVRISAAVLSLGLLVAGCSSSKAATNTATTSSVLSAACAAGQKANPSVVGKHYTVGTSPTQPSYEAIDPNNPSKIVGFDVDFLDAVSKCAGFTYTFAKSDFQALVPSLQAGRIDMVVANLIASPPRAKQVNFVIYQNDLESLLVAHGNPKSITTVSGLCGNSVAVFPGTVQAGAAQIQSDACTAAGKKPIAINTYTDFLSCVQAVLTGRSDATIDPISMVAATVAKYPSKIAGTDPIPEFRSQIGIAFNKSSKELQAATFAAVKSVQADGTEKKLMTNWKVDPSSQAATVELP
ncbi:MAG: polar amino acid transport system substrate-binding protein [Pseudonocardiales bacterium]|jgi:polar amino acid transport system substrate-binding protein|nr:polar amino acid transport system substrate-binding protein [Pseudonocardiales bacterium]